VRRKATPVTAHPNEARNDPVAQIKGLAEVVLNVRDMGRAVAFYQVLLGLEVISPPERKNPIFLRAGAATSALPAMVVLVQLPPEAGEFSLPRSLHHLALAIDLDDFDRVWKNLTERGFEIRTGEHPVIPSRTMYITDPDGNEVELIAAL
jgi:catechol-2,3-dioxygenase